MVELRAAIRTIHADRDWWKKILLGGALWTTVAGWPIVEGHQLESIDNSQRGYPTPLPHWNLLGDKAVLGLFAMVIDFFFFLFPILCGGVLLFCGTLAVGLTGNGAAARTVVLMILIPVSLYLAGVWGLGVSAVGKQRYVEGGELAEVLSFALVRELFRAPARGIYGRARLLSLPPYLVAVAILVGSLRLLGETIAGGIIAIWLGLSVLVYARLVTIQLYLAATRALETRRFELLRRRAET